MASYLVIVYYCEEQIYQFDTYEEAKQFAVEQKGYGCTICKIVAYKDEFKNVVEEI